MHPILREMLFEPVGWLVIAGALAMIGITVYLHWFMRKKMREEEQQRGGRLPDERAQG